MSETAVKLPAIEHIKARKDGLDVLADIYRYASLGFDAIDPDDLALFRWYGIYTQRAEASAESGVPGPSEDTDGHFMLRIKFPGGVVSADQLRTIGRLIGRRWKAWSACGSWVAWYSGRVGRARRGRLDGIHHPRSR